FATTRITMFCGWWRKSLNSSSPLFRSTTSLLSISVTIFLQFKRFRKKKTAYYIYPRMLNIQSIKLAAIEKWRRKTLIILLLLASQFAFAQSKYIKQFKPLADSLSEEYKIPTAVILGVAIIESGAGTSRNSKMLHN